MTVRKSEGGASRLRLRRFVGACSIALVFGLAWAGGVLADIPATRIVVEPPIAHPGEAIAVHGAFLWTDADVTVTLVGRAGASRTIGSAVTRGDGSLEMTTRVPDDMPTGTFRVAVMTSSGDSVDVELVIEPPFPIIPAAVITGSLLAVILVWRSALKRRVANG